MSDEVSYRRLIGIYKSRMPGVLRSSKGKVPPTVLTAGIKQGLRRERAGRGCSVGCFIRRSGDKTLGTRLLLPKFSWLILIPGLRMTAKILHPWTS